MLICMYVQRVFQEAKMKGASENAPSNNILIATNVLFRDILPDSIDFDETIRLINTLFLWAF